LQILQNFGNQPSLISYDIALSEALIGINPIIWLANYGLPLLKFISIITSISVLVIDVYVRKLDYGGFWNALGGKKSLLHRRHGLSGCI
jgi:hypothetical protein